MYMDRKTQYYQDTSSSQLVLEIQSIPLKILGSCFVDINQFKFNCKGKRPKITNTILKKNTVAGLTLPDVKTYYKTTVNKTMWYWWKNKQLSQWS